MNKIFLPNGMEAVKANYTESPLEEFNENPFIQALPPLVNEETKIKKLMVNPVFSIKERDMENMYRLQMVNRMYQFFQPLPIHLEIWDAIHNLLIEGYIARNPFDPAYVRHLNDSGKQVINRSYDINNRSNFRTTAGCGTLFGFSGMGKTTSVNRVLNNIPQIIVHNEYKGQHFNQIQMVWLKIDSPSVSSLKALCLQFIMRIDELLGTNNYQKHVSRNTSVDAMLPLIGQLAKNIALGLLIIDETQNIKNRGKEQIMNFFVSLVNSGVNLLLIGTPGAYKLFGDELRIARRLTGNSEIVFNNMEYDNEFKFLLESIWRYQWTSKQVGLTEEIMKVIYYETQGISDLVVKLFVYSQQKAISTKKEMISASLIQSVAKEKFKLMKEMVDAIRSGNPYKMSAYEDIKRIEKSNKADRSPEIEIKVLNKIREKEVKTNQNQNQMEKIVVPVQNRQNRIVVYDENDIRRIMAEGIKDEKTVYEILNDNDLIEHMNSWNDGVVID
ncbi:ATP-binding protein [Sporosarcina sp. BI001-red]|uniref:ATP-binding protein n=1 Tax=Sporosarcina sp. BI001-red TaxID=2282866 RepID=UPI001314FF62|nr:ATP-binding protein [Sporosarcina sp. BI001-red]